jgi:hypothetical protein
MTARWCRSYCSGCRPGTTLAVKGEWLTLSGEFMAQSGDHLLEILSHNASGDGNDFSITAVTVKSTNRIENHMNLS